MSSIDIATVIICAIGLGGCVLFIVAFHLRTGGRWWRSSAGVLNEIGIWLMISRINLGAIFALIFFNRVTPQWVGRTELTLGLVALFALQTFWPVKFLWSDSITATRQEGEVDHDSR